MISKERIRQVVDRIAEELDLDIDPDLMATQLYDAFVEEGEIEFEDEVWDLTDLGKRSTEEEDE